MISGSSSTTRTLMQPLLSAGITAPVRFHRKQPEAENARLALALHEVCDVRLTMHRQGASSAGRSEGVWRARPPHHDRNEADRVRQPSGPSAPAAPYAPRPRVPVSPL